MIIGGGVGMGKSARGGGQIPECRERTGFGFLGGSGVELTRTPELRSTRLRPNPQPYHISLFIITVLFTCPLE